MSQPKAASPGADKTSMCAATIKDRGRGVYVSHRCTRDAVEGEFCRRHADAYRRAVAKLAAYSGQIKHKVQL